MTEVIERIKAKEIERGKEKRNVPELRFRGFEDEWIEKKLNEITKLTDGVHFTPEYVNNGIQFWSVETIVSNVKPKYITKEANKLANKRCKPEKFDILMTRIGTLAKSKVLTDDNAINIYVSVALIKSNKIFNSFFLKQYFDTNIYYKDFLSKALLTAVPKKINMDSLKQTKVKLPSLQEQKKIADFFSLVDKKIEKQSEKVEALKTYKKGIMQKIFKQEIRFKDENGREYPEWENIQLDRICNIKKGEQINKLNLSLTGKYYVLNGGISYSGFTDRYNTEENTISISEGGNSCGYVNFNHNKFWSGGHCYTLLNLSSNIIVRYLYNYLKFKEKQIMNLRVGSGLPNIQKNALSALSITLPCFKEQTKIATFLSTIDKKIEKEEKKLEKLKVYKKGLLQKMFV